MGFSGKIGWVLAWVFTASFSAGAGELPLKVTAIPKTDENKRNIAGNVAVGVISGTYKVTVKNLSFSQPTPVIAVKYRVFVRRDDGMKHSRDVEPEFVSGETTLPALKPGEGTPFETKAVMLKQTSLNPNFYYTNNKRSATRDEMVGIWVRIYDGDKMLAEYLSSSKLARSGAF